MAYFNSDVVFQDGAFSGWNPTLIEADGLYSDSDSTVITHESSQGLFKVKSELNENLVINDEGAHFTFNDDPVAVGGGFSIRGRTSDGFNEYLTIRNDRHYQIHLNGHVRVNDLKVDQEIDVAQIHTDNIIGSYMFSNEYSTTVYAKFVVDDAFEATTAGSHFTFDDDPVAEDGGFTVSGRTGGEYFSITKDTTYIKNTAVFEGDAIFNQDFSFDNLELDTLKTDFGIVNVTSADGLFSVQDKNTGDPYMHVKATGTAIYNGLIVSKIEPIQGNSTLYFNYAPNNSLLDFGTVDTQTSEYNSIFNITSNGVNVNGDVAASFIFATSADINSVNSKEVNISKVMNLHVLAKFPKNPKTGDICIVQIPDKDAHVYCYINEKWTQLD